MQRENQKAHLVQASFKKIGANRLNIFETPSHHMARPSSRSERAPPRYPVVLHLYDLSRGVARELSPALLGTRLDAVYHSGIVVHGAEHYYGGLLATEPPGRTYYGAPLEAVPLGATRVDRGAELAPARARGRAEPSASAAAASAASASRPTATTSCTATATTSPTRARASSSAKVSRRA